MSQGIMKKQGTSTSLRRRGDAHTVLLRMAHDEARAQRIRALKARHVDVKWREIADYVGVSERSAIAWQKTGGISRPNVKKLAEFFRKVAGDTSVTADWIWRGDAPAVDLVEALNGDSPSVNDEVLSRLAGIEEQVRLLRAEVATNDAEALKRSEAVLRAIDRLPRGRRS